MAINNVYNTTPKRIFTNKPFINGMSFSNADLQPGVCKAVANLEMESSGTGTRVRQAVHNKYICKGYPIKFYSKLVIVNNLITESAYKNSIIDSSVSDKGIKTLESDDPEDTTDVFEKVIYSDTELEYSDNELHTIQGVNAPLQYNNITFHILQLTDGTVPYAINSFDYSLALIGIVASGNTVVHKGIIKLYFHAAAKKIVYELVDWINYKIDALDVSDYGVNLVSSNPYVYKDYLGDNYNKYMGYAEGADAIDILSVGIFDENKNAVKSVNPQDSGNIYIKPFMAIPDGDYGLVVQSTNVNELGETQTYTYNHSTHSFDNYKETQKDIYTYNTYNNSINLTFSNLTDLTTATNTGTKFGDSINATIGTGLYLENLNADSTLAVARCTYITPSLAHVNLPYEFIYNVYYNHKIQEYDSTTEADFLYDIIRAIYSRPTFNIDAFVNDVYLLIYNVTNYDIYNKFNSIINAHRDDVRILNWLADMSLANTKNVIEVYPNDFSEFILYAISLTEENIEYASGVSEDVKADIRAILRYKENFVVSSYIDTTVAPGSYTNSSSIELTSNSVEYCEIYYRNLAQYNEETGYYDYYTTSTGIRYNHDVSDKITCYLKVDQISDSQYVQLCFETDITSVNVSNLVASTWDNFTELVLNNRGTYVNADDKYKLPDWESDEFLYSMISLTVGTVTKVMTVDDQYVYNLNDSNYISILKSSLATFKNKSINFKLKAFPIIKDLNETNVVYKDSMSYSSPTAYIALGRDEVLDKSQFINEVKLTESPCNMGIHLGHYYFYGSGLGNSKAIYFSDYSNISYIPSNYIIEFDNEVIYAYTWQSNLLVFTTEDVFLLYGGTAPADVTSKNTSGETTIVENGFTKSLVLSNTRLPRKNIKTVCTLGKDAFFIADDGDGYLIKANKYVNNVADVYTMKITNAISDLFNNPYQYMQTRLMSYDASYNYIKNYSFTASTTNPAVIINETLLSRIIDGDTVEDTNGNRYRLADINAPESDTSAGQRATTYLTNLLDLSEPVNLIYMEDYKDIYGRYIAYLEYNSKNINYEMLKAGYASLQYEGYLSKYLSVTINNNNTMPLSNLMLGFESTDICAYATTSYLYLVQSIHFRTNYKFTIIYKYNINTRTWSTMDFIGSVVPVTITSDYSKTGYKMLCTNCPNSLNPSFSVLTFKEGYQDINEVDPIKLTKLTNAIKNYINVYFDSGNQALPLQNQKLFREVKIMMASKEDANLSTNYRIEFSVDGLPIQAKEHISGEIYGEEGVKKITFLTPSRGKIPRIKFYCNCQSDVNILEFAIVYLQLSAK